MLPTETVGVFGEDGEQSLTCLSQPGDNRTVWTHLSYERRAAYPFAFDRIFRASQSLR
jgi:hypothetical protein